MRTTPLRNRWLRFAVLRHTGYPGRENHYDILLEVAPGRDPDEPVMVKLESAGPLNRRELQVVYQGLIRRRYLQYEGPMTGNRGRVRRVDQGVYRLSGNENVRFEGKILKGPYSFDSGSPCESVRSVQDVGLLLKEAV